MNESFLHYIWKYKLFSTSVFLGTKNENIELIKTGDDHQDSGPDFFNAQIKVDGLWLAGNIEIHLKTSDWLKHQHHFDDVYNHLILHVVYEHDMDIPQNLSHHVPVLELKPYISPLLLTQYQTFFTNRSVVSCGSSITQVNDISWISWVNRLAVSKLENKSAYIESLFQFKQQNFEETLYVLLCRNFGFKTNSDAFELLAKQLPFHIIKKHLDQPHSVNALLFGMAGMLDEPFQEEYPRQLQNEFEFLKHKYNLIPLKKELWKFLRMRPVNFPTIRLAQLGAVLCQSQSLFHLLENRSDLKLIKQYFDIKLPAYWDTHFHFEKETQAQLKHIGEQSVDNIIINTVVPYLFFLAKHYHHEIYSDYAMKLLTHLPPEQNTKIKTYTELGVHPKNALETQALIYMYDQFCLKKRCLECQVAGFLLKKSKDKNVLV